MLPLILTPNSASIGVAGKGEALAGRLRMLDRAGFSDRVVFGERLPEARELDGLDILFVAGLGEAESRELHRAAKAHGTMVNVEDLPKFCDFHVPAHVRRGDLLITISTGGRSPGLSATVREFLEALFGEDWEAHLDELAVSRAKWRSAGLSPEAVAERTREYVAARGWVGGQQKG